VARPKKKHLGEPKIHNGRERVWWDGEWHDLGPEGSTEAKAKLARLTVLWAKDPTAPLRPKADYLVDELCRDYLASDDSPAEGQQRERVALAATLLTERYTGVPVADFGPADLEAWQAWLCETPSSKYPDRARFNITTVKDLVWTVRRIWKWGVRKRGVAVEKHQALLTTEWPKFGAAREPKVVEPADPAAVRAILPHLRPPPRAMVVLQLATGARPNELCGMRAGDVQRSGRIHIDGAGVHDLDQLGVWVCVLAQHKTRWKRKPRWLTFGPDVWPILEPFLQRGPEEFCFSPQESTAAMREERKVERKSRSGGSGGNRKRPAAEPKLKPGPRYSPRTYLQAVKRACVAAGVAEFAPYQLRHAAAAEIKALFDLDAVQALLGHHTKTMAEHYGGVAFRKAAEVAKGRAGG
jgi:integrase